MMQQKGATYGPLKIIGDQLRNNPEQMVRIDKLSPDLSGMLNGQHVMLSVSRLFSKL